MDDDFSDLATLSRPSFSFVMRELHQQFTEKNLDAPFDDDCISASSGFGSLSTERINNLSDCSWSSLEFRLATGTIPLKPQYSVKYIMGPICNDTIQIALKNLRPVPRPKDFLPSTVPSPRALPRTSTSFTAIEDLKIAHDIGFRNEEDAQELTRSVEEYQSVDFEYATKEEENSNIHATPSPCPENIYGWQTGSYLNGGLNRHTNCIELDTDMIDRFIIELKPRGKKRGLLSRLRFWKKHSKSKKDVCGIGSDKKDKDKKRCGGWRLFCCFKSC